MPMAARAKSAQPRVIRPSLSHPWLGTAGREILSNSAGERSPNCFSSGMVAAHQYPLRVAAGFRGYLTSLST